MGPDSGIREDMGIMAKMIRKEEKIYLVLFRTRCLIALVRQMGSLGGSLLFDCRDPRRATCTLEAEVQILCDLVNVAIHGDQVVPIFMQVERC